MLESKIVKEEYGASEYAQPILPSSVPTEENKTFTRAATTRVLAVAFTYAFLTTFQVSAFSISLTSLAADLQASPLQSALGISTYGWGFALGPLIFAPITERYGRYHFFLLTAVLYSILHLSMTLAQNVTTIIIARFFFGLAGCGGAVVVAGMVSDLHNPEDRSTPMSIFTLAIVGAPGLGGLCMCWVEANPRLQWRWVQWILMSVNALFAVSIISETRSAVNQRASRSVSLLTSCRQPIIFLFTEPVVTCFALWAGLSWGIFYFVIAGMPYILEHEFGFNIQQTGLAFSSLTIGALIGFFFTPVQAAMARHYWPRFGIESRLCAGMIAAPVFAIGCGISGATATPSGHWIGPCIGAALVTASVYTIDQTCFVYLSECYGQSASSAIAAMAFLRVAVGSSFAIVTQQAFDALTCRWALVMLGGIQLVFTLIPVGAFIFGPKLRSNSRYCVVE